jgi:hypothetical protein
MESGILSAGSETVYFWQRIKEEHCIHYKEHAVQKRTLTISQDCVDLVPTALGETVNLAG